ncbi:E3 ubiquitin-protein ligase RGLG2-like [Andrographis paniculata]|uniref:E3 ubiquitin-protein ligase RGLG2-like n=1 Tax=Andrographis paniculata TaxID=175694 RepID=UPI0021E78038|nr:E3 ubiquitin-protein ligase RGLG2-like [Andrographis paniculata]
MGSKISCLRNGRSSEPAVQSSKPAGWHLHHKQASFSRYAQNYPVPGPYSPNRSYTPTCDDPTPSPHAPLRYDMTDAQMVAPQKKLDKRYSRIANEYNSLEEVSQALAHAGLASSNLIIGIDFTKSNEWTGKNSCNGRSLHHVGDGLNPYEQAITVIGKTLMAFGDDNFIPCFGFGDASTQDRDVFSFYPDGAHCNGFEEVLHRYRELVPNLKLAGPTSFAPIIEMAMTLVEQKAGQFHVLLIIADGQVTRSVETELGEMSLQEQETVDAIVEASKLPLSIVLVGVGDGPWDTMKEFDDNIPARSFDNFQFVDFTRIMSKYASQTRKETEFALSALMEIPSQYKAAVELNLLGGWKGERVALPPPFSGSVPKLSTASSSSYYENRNHVHTDAIPSSLISVYERQICPICLCNLKDLAFGCGHQTCRECGKDLRLCPVCRSRIETKIQLY